MISADQLDSWGIQFKEGSFRPFRFPACADRVLCWVPDALHKRMSWSLPRGGYKVDHRQGGSDHRPVYLEAVLRIDPEPAAPSGPGAAQSEIATEASRLLAAVCAEDSDESPEEGVPTVSSTGSWL